MEIYINVPVHVHRQGDLWPFLLVPRGSNPLEQTPPTIFFRQFDLSCRFESEYMNQKLSVLERITAFEDVHQNYCDLAL